MNISGMARKIGIGVVARGFSQVTALMLAIVAARLLAKDQFGVYAIASAFVVLLQALMYGGIYDFVIKDKSSDEILDTCFWMNIIFGVLATSIVATLSVVMGDLTHSAEVTSLMLWLAPSAIIASITTWQEAVLLRRGRLTTYYTLWIITETLAFALALTLFYHGFGLFSLVAYRYAQLSLGGLFYLFIVRLVPRFEWRQHTARSAWRFAVNIYISRMAGIMASYSGDVLVGILVNPAAAGAYRLGSRIVLGVSEIAYQPVTTMAWVHFSKTEAKPEALRIEWLALVTALSVTAWPALVGLAFNSRSVLALVVGPGWGDAIPVIEVLVFARVLGAFEVFLDPTLGVLDRSSAILKIRTVGSISAIALLFGAARFGAVGAAIAQATVAAGLASVAVAVALRATRTSLGSLLRRLVPGLTCTLATLAGAMAAVDATGVVPTSPLPYIAVSAAGGIVFWAATLLVNVRLFNRDLARIIARPAAA
jgi:O-antigen/teichoic acid export membrane protein